MLQIPPIAVVPGPDVELANARRVMEAESRALALVAERLGESFNRAIELISESPGNVIVTGMGKAGLIAQKVSATLASTGTPAHFLHPAEARHGDLGRLSPGDVVLAFSHSGETEEVIHLIPAIRDFGVGVVGITNKGTSSLARWSDVAIVYGPVEEACPIGLAPSTSCSVMLGIGDAIAFVLMQRHSFRAEDFGRLHPAGSLGRKLRRVEHVMRTGGGLRIAPSAQTVREVFAVTHRPGRRTGAICLVDSAGRLDGIFTDSDLARLFEGKDLAPLDRPIAEFMTRQPITIRAGWLVKDVLELLRTYQVSEIPVLDLDDRPIGIVDITDLVDLLPEAA